MSFLDTNVGAADGYWYRIRLDNIDGTTQLAGPVAVESGGTLLHTVLHSPFDTGSGPLQIRYDLARSGEPVRVDIFTASGRLVRSLDRSIASAGYHAVYWDRRNDAGSPAARGTYLVRLAVGSTAVSKKLLLIHR